jgi:hypothetical protein
MTGNLRYPSRTFVVLEAIYDALEAATFDTPAPTITFGDPWGVTDAREVVGVRLSVDDDSITWARMGPAGRDEVFSVVIEVAVMTPGLSGTEMLERLGELSEVVEGILFDFNGRTVTPLVAVDGVTDLTGFSRVAPSLERTKEGYVGSVELVISVDARI